VAPAARAASPVFLNGSEFDMNRAQLPLTALRAFEVTARQRSLKLACAELHLTPGAISQQVRALEERLGVQLFDRASGRYALTVIGAQLLPRLSHSFDGMESALRDVLDSAEPHRLRLKLAPTFAARWLAPRLADFFAHNPGIDLEVTTVASTAEIGSEHCDFLVQFGTPPWPDFDHILLFEDELIPVCTPKIARTLRKPEDLKKHTLLHSSFRPANWAQWLESAGMGPELAGKGPKFPNALLAAEAAASGAGVAVMQKAYVAADLAQGRLVAPLQHAAKSGHGYYMTSSKHRRGERKIRQFARWIGKFV
jgi:LysR family glycine cleavage system transcriptional activator